MHIGRGHGRKGQVEEEGVGVAGLDERQQANPQPNKHISIKTLDGSTGNSSKCSSNNNNNNSNNKHGDNNKRNSDSHVGGHVLRHGHNKVQAWGGEEAGGRRQAGRQAGAGSQRACHVGRSNKHTAAAGELCKGSGIAGERADSSRERGLPRRGRLFALHCGRRCRAHCTLVAAYANLRRK